MEIGRSSRKSVPSSPHLPRPDRLSPPLKTAPVFGGIAGIAAVEPGDHDDSNCKIALHISADPQFPVVQAMILTLPDIPSLVNKSREIREMQDMYRRTLVASWSCQAGELPADECIEDIFAGGDGWRDKDAVSKPPLPREKQGYAEEDMDWISDVENTGRKGQGHQRRQGTGSIAKARSGGGRGHVRGVEEHGSMGDVRSRVVPRRDGTGGSGGSGRGNNGRLSHEIDELDARED